MRDPSSVMPGQQLDDPIVEVWASNIDAEFKKIRGVIKKYNYVSMVKYVFMLAFLTSSDCQIVMMLLLYNKLSYGTNIYYLMIFARC